MTDTGIGYYLALGMGAIAAGTLAFIMFRAFVFTIKFLLTKRSNGER